MGRDAAEPFRLQRGGVDLMARYPTYRRGSQLSASITRPPNVDQAALRETAKGYQSLADNARRVVNFASKELETKAKAEGVQAGLADPTGTLSGKGGERPTYSVYEQAAFDAAVGIASVDIETQAKTEMQNAWLRYQKDKGDPQDLAQELADIRNGYAQSMADLDPLTAAKLNKKLESSAQSVFLDYSTDHLKREQKRLDGQGITLYSDTRRQVESLGRQTGDDTALGELLAEYTDSAEALGQTGTAAFQKGIEDLKTRFHRARVRGEFDRAKKVGNADQYIEKFQADLDKGKGLARGLLEEGKKTLGNEMATYMRSELAASRATAAAKAKQLKAEIKRVGENATTIEQTLDDDLRVGEERIIKLRAEAAATNDPELIADVENLAVLWDFHKNHRGLPPRNLRAIAAQYKKEAGADKNIDKYERDRIAFIESMAARAEKMRNKPVEFFAQINDQRPLKPISLGNPAGMRDRVAEINDFSIRMYGNKATVFLSEVEKEDLSEKLSNASVAEQMEAFIRISAGFGDHAIDVLKQISPKNPVAANVGALLNITKDRDFTFDVLVGQNALKPDTTGVPGYKFPTAVKPDIEAAVEERLAAAGVQPEDIARTKQTILAYAAGKASQGEEFDPSKPKELERAIQRSQGGIVINGEHIAGGIHHYNDRPVIVPPSIAVDEDDPNSLVKLFEGDSVVRYTSGRRKTNEYFADPLGNDDWDTLGIRPYINGKPYPISKEMYDGLELETYDNNAVILLYKGQRLMGKNSQPIVLDLNDLVSYRQALRAGAAF